MRNESYDEARLLVATTGEQFQYAARKGPEVRRAISIHGRWPPGGQLF